VANPLKKVARSTVMSLFASGVGLLSMDRASRNRLSKGGKFTFGAYEVGNAEDIAVVAPQNGAANPAAAPNLCGPNLCD
jgi:hypothetical protein